VVWVVLTVQSRGLWLSDCKFGMAWPLCHRPETHFPRAQLRRLGECSGGDGGGDVVGGGEGGGMRRTRRYKSEAEDGQVVGNRGRGLLARLLRPCRQLLVLV
jgi:hypothetical protein